MEWSVHTAHQFALDNRLTEWVDAYLRVDEWINLDFADGLQTQPRWWLGPVLFPLETLNRLCGPEDGMRYPADPGHWERKVKEFAGSADDPAALPPIITQIIDGKLCVGDGNHRVEAARRKGWEAIWGIIWFDSKTDWQEHKVSWKTYSQHFSDENRSEQAISSYTTSPHSRPKSPMI